MSRFFTTLVCRWLRRKRWRPAFRFNVSCQIARRRWCVLEWCALRVTPNGIEHMGIGHARRVPHQRGQKLRRFYHSNNFSVNTRQNDALLPVSFCDEFSRSCVRTTYLHLLTLNSLHQMASSVDEPKPISKYGWAHVNVDTKSHTNCWTCGKFCVKNCSTTVCQRRNAALMMFCPMEVFMPNGQPGFPDVAYSNNLPRIVLTTAVAAEKSPKRLALMLVEVDKPFPLDERRRMCPTQRRMFCPPRHREFLNTNDAALYLKSMDCYAMSESFRDFPLFWCAVRYRDDFKTEVMDAPGCFPFGAIVHECTPRNPQRCSWHKKWANSKSQPWDDPHFDSIWERLATDMRQMHADPPTIQCVLRLCASDDTSGLFDALANDAPIGPLWSDVLRVFRHIDVIDDIETRKYVFRRPMIIDMEKMAKEFAATTGDHSSKSASSASASAPGSTLNGKNKAQSEDDDWLGISRKPTGPSKPATDDKAILFPCVSSAHFVLSLNGSCSFLFSDVERIKSWPKTKDGKTDCVGSQFQTAECHAAKTHGRCGKRVEFWERIDGCCCDGHENGDG